MTPVVMDPLAIDDVRPHPAETMNIELRLFASLRKYLPAGSPRGKCHLHVPRGMSLGALIDHMRIPERSAHLVLINGIHNRNTAQPLSEGDVVSVFPPVAGG